MAMETVYDYRMKRMDRLDGHEVEMGGGVLTAMADP